jgi:hypothetical protein
LPRSHLHLFSTQNAAMTVSRSAVRPFWLFLPMLARHGPRRQSPPRPSKPVSLSPIRFPPSRGSTQTAHSWSPSLVSTVLLRVSSFSSHLRQPTCSSTLLPYPRPFPQYNTHIPYITRSTTVLPRIMNPTDQQDRGTRHPERPTSSLSPNLTFSTTASWPFFPSIYVPLCEHS